MRANKYWLAKVRDKGYLLIIFCLVTSFILIYLSQQKAIEKVIFFASKQNVMSHADIVESFRTLYTNNVIKKLENSKFEITHKHLGVDNTIPLPATMTIELGEAVSKKESGISSHLYSPYPFPWRKDKGGLKDSFQQQAWEKLSGDPDGEFYRVEIIAGEQVIRYAKADVMRTACIHCHNTHPNSPKRDWLIGDVRGILEIRQSISKTIEAANLEVQSTHLYLAISVLLGAFGFIAILLSYRTKIRLQYGLENNLKKQNIELTKAYDDLEQFSYRSSHDLKGPLTTIKGLARYIEKDIKSGNIIEASENANKIYANAQKLESLVVELLDLAKADLADYPVQKINVTTIVDDINFKNANLIRQKNVVINIEDELDDQFQSEYVRVLQILENLITNAVKYSDPDKSSRFVLIKAYRDNGKFVVSVKDNGLGIPNDRRDEVFSIFKRFHPTASEGNGLGLSLVKRHVDHLGGSLEVSHLPKGTIFTIHFN